MTHDEALNNILQYLIDNGPAYYRPISEALEIHNTRVGKYLKELYEQGEIHIAGYEFVPRNHGYAAIYGYGDHSDAKHPRDIKKHADLVSSMLVRLRPLTGNPWGLLFLEGNCDVVQVPEHSQDHNS